MRIEAGLGLSLVGLLSACATAVPSKPVAQFPAAEALAAIAAKRSELPVLPTGEVPAEGWTVDPARVVVEPSLMWAPEGVWDRAFARAFTTPGRTSHLSRAMSCVAGELGRFYAEHKAMPPESLQRFVSAACGVYEPAVAYQSLTATAPPDTSDEALLARFEEQLGTELVGRLPANATDVGFWFGRHGERVVALATYGFAPVEMAPFSVVPDKDGSLTLEGRVLRETDLVAAFVNQGRYGVAPCLVDAAMSRPHFHVTCRLAKDDETAWIQVVYAPTGTVLALPILQVLARRDPQKPLRFLEPPAIAAHLATGAEDFKATMLEGLNAARAQAALPPVRMSAPQSQEASRVARQYFAASQGAGNPQDVNTVVLGLLAGWQVRGLIRSGDFFSAMLPNTRDVSRWLDFALALPLGRSALLDRDVEEIACGPAFTDEPGGVGAIVTSYRFQHGTDHAADIAALHARIQAARQRRGLAPAQRLRFVGDAIAEELAAVQRGDETPIEAMESSLQSAVGNVHTYVRGFVYEAMSLDAVELPPAFIANPNLRYEIGVTHHKPPGAAWSQLVIIFICEGSAPGIQA